MSGLNTSLSIATQSLAAAEGALQITNNNIANANTPGYSRELVTFESATATDQGQGVLGNGVVLAGYQSVRDELLQLRINQQTSEQGSADAQLGSLSQVQPVFTTSNQDIGTEFSQFFSSVSALSTDPTSASGRQAVISSAQNLTTAFHSASNAIIQQQSALDDNVKQDVTQINALASQIAAVGGQISQARSTGQNTGILQDQQDQLVLKLSGLTDVSVTHTEGSDTITTGNGIPLVSAGTSFALSTTTGADGSQHVLSSTGQDITSTLQGGNLGGTIQARTQSLGGLLTQLDTLANQFVTAFNTAQTKGFDQSGVAGAALFTVPATIAGSAAGITLATNSPTAIAASSDGSSGSDGNISNLSAVQTAALPSGQNPAAAFSSIVFQVGTLTAGAQADSTATASSLAQLTDQRNAVSGVSIDEETTNLITYQQAYQAAAQVVNTVNTLITATMAMVSNVTG